MKKPLLIALSLMCVLGAYTRVFAQYGLDDSGVVIDSAVDAASKLPLDTPVGGIGTDLAETYQTFLSTISGATDGMGSALTGSFQGVAIPIVALALGVYAIRMISGLGNEEPKKAAIMLILAAFITSIVFTPGQYESWVAGPIIGTTNSLANFLVTKATGGQAGNVILTMAGGMDKVMAACVKIDRSIELVSPIKSLCAVIAMVLLSASYLMVLVTFMLINIMTWFAIYLMKVFGAVCLFFAIFTSTRHIFWAWLRAMCNYGLVIVFASLIMGVCLKVMLPQMEIIAAQDYGTVHPLLNGATYTCVAINALSWCMLLRAPDLAAALSGGSAGNTAGIAGVVSMSAGAIYGGAKWAAVTRFRGVGGKTANAFRDGLSGNSGSSMAAAGNGPSARKGIDNSSY